MTAAVRVAAALSRTFPLAWPVKTYRVEIVKFTTT
jgi:hypothetical protein